MSIDCAACKIGAAARCLPFDGGYLHDSREYDSLLHCNFCGTYYERVSLTLRQVHAMEVRDYRTTRRAS